MKSILVDTNVLIDFLEHANRSVADSLASYDELVLTPVVVGEYLAGLRKNARGAIARAQFSQFLADDSVRVTTTSVNTSRCYADVFNGLRDKGQPIPQNDLWIAATAKENDLPLMTKDCHFGYIDNLEVINPFNN